MYAKIATVISKLEKRAENAWIKRNIEQSKKKAMYWKGRAEAFREVIEELENIG